MGGEPNAQIPASLLPFTSRDLLEAVTGSHRIVDAGCGAGRLTVALALSGHETTGFDTNARQLERARERARELGVSVTFAAADLGSELPFPGSSFDAAVSRLVLMVMPDPTAALRGLSSVVRPGGVVATAVWARIERNPWFGEPRAAVADVLGPERAGFARPFGRLGTPEELGAVHEAAGLEDVSSRLLAGERTAADAAAYWSLLAAENDHFARIEADLGEQDRHRLLSALTDRLRPYEREGSLVIPRAVVLATARVTGAPSS